MSDTIAMMKANFESMSMATGRLDEGAFPYPLININDQALALVPTRHCLLQTVSVNARNKRDLDAAIPFALEEKLADPVEVLEFVYSDKAEDGSRHVLVCRKEKIDAWQQSLQGREAIMIPDALALPWSGNSWTVLIDANRALVRTGLLSGYECELQHLGSQLQLSLDQLEEPDRIEAWLPVSIDELNLPDTLSARVSIQRYQETLAGFFQARANPATQLGIAVNVAGGNDSSRTFKSWLPALAMAGLALVVYVASSMFSTASFNAETDKLQQQTETLFRETFPDVNRIVNMRVQAEQYYKSLAEQKVAPDSGFFQLFSRAMSVIAGINNMSVSNINWQQQTMQLQVSAATVADIELIKATLEAENYAVDMVNAVNQGAEYSAQLKIRAVR